MTAVLYVLCTMWAIGTLAACGFVATEAFETLIQKISVWFILLPVWVLVGIGPMLLLAHETGPVVATLLESEWECTASHAETTYVMVNKVMVPSTSTICDTYGRKK